MPDTSLRKIMANTSMSPTSIPSTPPQQLRSAHQFSSHQQHMLSHYQPQSMSYDSTNAQLWQQPRVHPSYILTSNNRPTSAPMRMLDGDASDGLSTPASAHPTTPSTSWGYPSDDPASAASMSSTGMPWRSVPTSHPAMTMDKTAYPSSLPSSFDDHTYSNYSMFTTPMVHYRDEHMNAHTAPRPATYNPSTYYGNNATLSPSWTADAAHDGASIITSAAPSRGNSRSPMVNSSSPLVKFEHVTPQMSLEPSISMGRKSRKRQMAGQEDPRCQCDICGKFFQRAYNLRAHKETHNPARSQPFECEFDGCDKRFVRKTDLSRHVKSVHVQTREHSCDQCGARFARKDTMRRHAFDGCPARQKANKKRAPKHAYFKIVDSPLSTSLLNDPPAMWS